MKLIPKKTVLTLLVACVILAGAATFLFIHLGSLLIVSEQPPRVLDVIYTLSGEGTRIIYAKKVYPLYPHSMRIMSCPQEMRKDTAFQHWVRVNGVTTVDTCANTRSEISYLKNALAQKNGSLLTGKVTTVGIISNWYHMRRVQCIISAQLSHAGYRFYYLPVPSEMDPYRTGATVWWRQKQFRYIVFSEWEKIVLYWLQHIV